MWVMAVYAPANDMGADAHRGARAVRTAGATESFCAQRACASRARATGAGSTRQSEGLLRVRGQARLRTPAPMLPGMQIAGSWALKMSGLEPRGGGSAMVRRRLSRAFARRQVACRCEAAVERMSQPPRPHPCRGSQVRACSQASCRSPRNSTAASMPGAAILRGCSWPWPRSHPPPRCVHSHSHRQARVACPQASRCREGRERTR